MADFTKDIRLKFKVDTKTLDTIERQFSDVLDVIDSNAAEEFKKYQASIKLLKTYQDALSAIADLQGENWDKERQRLQEQIELIKDYKNLDLSDEAGDISEGSQKNLDALKDVGQWFIKQLTKVFTDAWQEAQELVDYGQLSSSATRELRLGYGFSGAQAYGYEQALSLVGLSSMEDLWYANPQEREQFYNAFEKYTEKYNKLADSGFFEELQEVQYEWKEIQDDFQLEIIQFFADNKDLIVNTMKFGLKVGEVLIQTLGKLVDALNTSGRSDSTRSSAISDVIRNYSTNKNSQVSVKVDNTFNGIGTKDQSMLTNAGQMVWGQIIKALEQ